MVEFIVLMQHVRLFIWVGPLSPLRWRKYRTFPHASWKQAEKVGLLEFLLLQTVPIWVCLYEISNLTSKILRNFQLGEIFKLPGHGAHPEVSGTEKCRSKWPPKMVTKDLGRNMFLRHMIVIFHSLIISYVYYICMMCLWYQLKIDCWFGLFGFFSFPKWMMPYDWVPWVQGSWNRPTRIGWMHVCFDLGHFAQISFGQWY